METRKFANLILISETKFLIGDYTFDGNVVIKENSVLIVCGNLTINGDLTLENSELIVSGKLWITDHCSKISDISTDISVGELKLSYLPYVDTIFCIKDGDLFVADKMFSEIKISSNSEITVLGDLEVEDDISCSNLSVGGYTDCFNVNAILDIYCLLGINSKDLSARDIYTEGRINCNNGEIRHNGQIHAPEGIEDCSYLHFRR